MPESSVVALLLTKAKLFGGPVVAALCIGASAAWYARGERAADENLVQRVAAVEAVFVTRGDLNAVILRLEGVAARQDSTNALLRRWICRDAPSICP